MTQAIHAPAGRFALGRSVLAVLAGLVFTVVVSTIIDHLLHIIEVYPPWGQAMWETSDNLLALSYRIAIGVMSGYIVAKLAPKAPIAHALVLGAIGTVLTIAGTIAAMSMKLGPLWYPVLLAASLIPTVYLGARLALRSKQ
jgi:hypothetical protein